MTGTVGSGLAKLTFDEKYLEDREKRKMTQQPRHFGEGLLYGTKDLATGMVEGFTGPIVQPIRGIQTEGATGFAKGLGKGLLGYKEKR